MKFGKCITFFLTFLPAFTAWADSTSFDQAVNEYLKGFRACTEANSLRSTDILLAKDRFDIYLRQLDTAIAIDNTILQTSDRDMDANIQYCERVENNLKRAEAAPVLERAFTFCEQAKTTFEYQDFDETQALLEQYQRYKEDAFAITKSLMEIYALASQVRACGRLEEKLAERQKLQHEKKLSLERAITGFEKFKLECESTLAYIQSSKFGVAQLDQANSMLNSALKYKKNAHSEEDAFILLQQFPDKERSLVLAALISSARSCEAQVSDSLRSTSKEKRQQQKALADATDQLEQSLALCRDANNLMGTDTSTEQLAKAIEIYRQSAAIKKTIVANRNLINTGKMHAQSAEGHKFSQAMSLTKQCQSSTVKQINEHKRALASVNARETSTQEPVEESDDTTEAASNPEEDEDDDFESFTEDNSTTSGAGKSWTDLIH